MRLLFRSALPIFLLVSAAQASNNATFDAEELGKIPACGLEKCLIWTIPEIGCSLLDVACHCKENVVHRLTTITANCMYANCTVPEALELAKIQAAICDFPSESRNEFLKIMTITCTIITYGTVLTRLATRYLLGQQLGSDDYCIIAAAISDAIFTAFGGRFEENGFGEHIWNIDLDVVPQLFLFFYLCEILYVITIALIKYSILFFYLRIFPKRSFRLTCWLLMAFCTASAIAFVLITIFQCRPINYVWRKDVRGTCLNYNAAAWANAGINIVQDILILVIPISEVRHLQLTKKRKLGMYAMFSVGGLVCVFSMIRLNSLKDFGLTADPTWDNVDMTFWTTLETTSAIVCACMPSIRALGVRYCPNIMGSGSRTARGVAGSGIHLSRTTHVQSMRVTKDDDRPESQESWMANSDTSVPFTTRVVGGKVAYHNTYNTKPTFPAILENETVDTDSETKKHSGVSSTTSLDAMPYSDTDWDKSLPPTPVYSIPMSLSSAHIGEQAARTLHSKFSSHYKGSDRVRKP